MVRLSGRSVLLLSLLAFVVCVSPIPAEAHANLVSSTVAPGSTLQSSPSQVCMTFSEQLEKDFSTFSVLNSAGTQVDERNLSFSSDDLSMCVSLPPSLPDGVYTVSWRTQSAVDGHIVESSFPFAVGNASLLSVQPPAAAAQSSELPSPIEVAIQWVTLTSEIVLVGSAAFELAVWNGASRAWPGWTETHQDKSTKVLRGTRTVAFGVFAGSAVARLTQQAFNSGGGSVSAKVLSEVLLGSRFGSIWLAQVGVVVAGAASVFIIRRGGARTPSLREASCFGIVGLLLMATTSLDSHNAATITPFGFLPTVSDWIHLASVGLWLGGLFQFVLLVMSFSRSPALRDDLGAFLAILVPRFSLVAILSIVAIGTTGFFSALIQLRSLDSLFTSTYGQVLLVKLLLIIPVVSIGAINHFAIHRSLVRSSAAPGQSSSSKFVRSVKFEAAFAVILLIAVSVLVGTGPPSTVPSTNQGLSFSGTDQGASVRLGVYPGVAGINQFTVSVTNSSGQRVTDVSLVLLYFTLAGGALGTSKEFANATAAGTYSVSGADMEIPGSYSVEVDVARSHHYDAIVTVQAEIGNQPRSPAESPELTQIPLTLNGASPNDVVSDSSGVMWFTLPQYGSIGSYNPSLQKFSYYHVPGSASPNMLTVAEDGAIWFTDTQGNRIFSFDPQSHSFANYTVPTPASDPGAIVSASNASRIWFTEVSGNKIGVLDTGSGKITEYSIPTPGASPLDLAADGGAIWFTESHADKIGVVNPDNGSVVEHTPPTQLNYPVGIAVGKDGLVWFTQHGANLLTSFSPADGSYHNYPVPVKGGAPYGLAVDPSSGNVWFAEHIGNAIGILFPNNGTIETHPIPNGQSNTQWVGVDQSGNLWFAEASGGELGVYGSVAGEAPPFSVDPSFVNLLWVATGVLVLVAVVMIYSAYSKAGISRRSTMRRASGAGVSHTPEALRDDVP